MRNELEFVIPETSLEFVEVDGRSADIIFDKGKYNDIEKVFPVRVYKEKDRTIAMQLREIAAWLYLDKVYSPLIFSEDNEYYYQALGYSGISAKDKKRDWLDIDFIFKCQPFVFRQDGDEEREIKNNGVIINPEAFESLPVITFNKTTSTEDSHIYINGQQFQIAKEAGEGMITLDCENGIAYKNGVNVTKYCLLNSDGYQPLVLNPGRNQISYTYIDQLKIKPKWRTLAV
ncbi:phage tail protein [Enterococcus durans]|uniref:phage tail protein n=1 Tax=Enterococcus durans TaxID=53345 RepID=UPI00288E7719|nr:phage tail protein [Enterococcus durans]MDT2836269.1 phage tail protein [Enterococcus durans]